MDESQLDIVLEHVERLCARDELSSNEEARSTGNAQHGTELGGILYRLGPLAVLKFLFKALHVRHTGLASDGNQFLFSELRVALALFPGLLKQRTGEFPELALSCRGTSGLSILGSLLAVDGHVVPLQADQALIDVLFHEGRLGFVCELRAERAFEVRVDRDYDRRIHCTESKRIIFIAAVDIVHILRGLQLCSRLWPIDAGIKIPVRARYRRNLPLAWCNARHVDGAHAVEASRTRASEEARCADNDQCDDS